MILFVLLVAYKRKRCAGITSDTYYNSERYNHLNNEDASEYAYLIVSLHIPDNGILHLTLIMSLLLDLFQYSIQFNLTIWIR